ncbi:hypothetical protein QZH41_002421 [Actinostola sp. cb2023]|nr:hypothetical protein QZH41_002421 [Actinostola sp. cb2023]
MTLSCPPPEISHFSVFRLHPGGSQTLTTSTGIPVDTNTSTMTVGPRGPVLMQDTQYMDVMSHFDRERIPERVVHAKGGGAFGYFEVTHDITKYCKAKVFERVGKKTDCVLRFSTVVNQAVLILCVTLVGFAMKFYTEDGNWDLVGNNTPIFFIRDPILDPDMFWDFITLRPETTHQVSFLFSDRGIPNGHAHMNGYGSHSFKMINAAGNAVYCKFHLKTNQGAKNVPVSEASRLAGEDPDYSNRDLYNRISNGNFPSWSMFIQVMTFDEAEKFRFNPFDLTKVSLEITSAG